MNCEWHEIETYAMAVVWMTTPKMNTAVAINIAYFLDAVSAIKPERSVPTQAPSSRIEVSHPLRD